MLESIGLVNLEISPSNFEENLDKSTMNSSQEYVIRTSEMKMKSKIEELKMKIKDEWFDGKYCDIIIAADTIISINDKEIFEKPKDDEDAFKMLRYFSDVGVHDVYTSVWITFIKMPDLK